MCTHFPAYIERITCPCILCVQLPESAGPVLLSPGAFTVKASYFCVKSFLHELVLMYSWSLCVRRYRTRDSGFSCAHRCPHTCNQALSTLLKRWENDCMWTWNKYLIKTFTEVRYIKQQRIRIDLSQSPAHKRYCPIKLPSKVRQGNSPFFLPGFYRDLRLSIELTPERSRSQSMSSTVSKNDLIVTFILAVQTWPFSYVKRTSGLTSSFCYLASGGGGALAKRQL